MKHFKLQHTLIIILSILTLYSCKDSGGIWVKDGSSFKFGNDDMSSNLISLAEAYSARNPEKLFTFYSDSFLTDKRKEWSKKYLGSLDSLSMVPYKIVPLISEDGKYREVIAWSKEERIYKNGSYEKLDLMEVFGLDESGKVNLFKQWKAIDTVNFGMPYGGKFIGIGENEYSGRPLVFSNRGEVEMIEGLAESYNAMDVESFTEYFAEEVEFKSYDGKTYNYKKSDLSQVFKPYKSINWKLTSIVPLKIFNTDAASGAMVLSTETRVFKNGKKWKKELMELIYFDLEGKISGMLQFAR
ncbi:MAG: hypothetical protein ACO3MA_00265 [Flavobacteriaceae bacterium]